MLRTQTSMIKKLHFLKRALLLILILPVSSDPVHEDEARVRLFENDDDPVSEAIPI